MSGWWAHTGSNLGPLPCEGNALPLSYAPGILLQNQRPEKRRLTPSEPAIYEVRGRGVKLIASNSATGSRPLLAGAGGVGLQRPDALGERAAAFGSPAGGGRTIGDAAVGGFCHLRRNRRVGGGQHGFDRRIRPFELHREFCQLDGDIVDAL